MKVAVVGVNHKLAPIKVREKVAFSEAKKIEATDYFLNNGIEEVVILSTCNRSEIYFRSQILSTEDSISLVKNFYKEFFKIENINEFLFELSGKFALEHLYRVTSGLDSIVLGEDQILGQVREAHLFSMEFGASKKLFNKLFKDAVTTAKEVKQSTKISEIPLSISYIGVKYLKQELGTLEGKKALIVGLGEMGRLAFRHLLEEGIEQVYMCNRNHDKVYDLSKEFPEIIPIDYKDRYECLANVDILMTATSSPHTVIKSSEIKSTKPSLYMMDLALPRDIDPKVKELESVTLYDIDDLTKISMENEQKRQELAKTAMFVVKDKVEEFIVWSDSIKVDPVIKSLNKKCQEIEEDTLNYIYRKMNLGNREKKILEKMLSSALSRVIRDPILKLKSIDEDKKREAYIELMGELFEL